MVRICPECCAANNDDAIFCSCCGIQLTVSPPVPAEWLHQYESLRRNVGDLSNRNLALEERLQKAIGEVKTLTDQLKADEQLHKVEIDKELSQRNRALDEQLAKAMAEVRALSAQIRVDEQARRTETTKMAELVDANRRLAQQVRQLTARPTYCDRCGRPLISTANPNVVLCPVCDLTWTVNPQPYVVAPQSPQGWGAETGTTEGDYSHPGSMHAGRAWHGIYIHENCGFCGQQLVQTSDPSVLYCPYCGRYQPHVHK